MASFLSPNYVPEFSPAISTIPIDLYGKVIMQKQAEYNQGVQRTQAYIQNVTGLEMGREQDQQYYNQKVGEYKQKIQGLLTSDFSAPDVVMQTSSISSQLYNDKRIRNSVMSRLYEKDIYQQIQKAQQDGTYAPENAEPVLQAVNNWKQGDENAVLGKMTYTPFDNYTPRLQAYMKSLNPNIRLDQNSPIGADGRPLPYVLQEGKVVAVDDAKVMTAYNSFFQTDASARNQRGLTTAYYSKNITDEQARDALKSTHDQAIRSIDNDIKFRENLLVTQSQDPQRVAQLNSEIEQLRSNRIRREQNYQQDLNDFVNNPLQVKANLYDMEQRRQIADVFGYKQESAKLLTDPAWEAAYKVQQDAYKVQQDALQQQNNIRDYNLKVRTEDRLQAEAEAKALKDARESGISGGLPPLQPENLATLDPSFSRPENVDERINLAMQSAGMDIFKFVYDAATTEKNGIMVSANSHLIEKNGDVYTRKQGVTAEQVNAVFFQMKKEWEAGRVKASPRIMQEYSDYFDSTDESRGYAKFMKAFNDSQNWNNLKRQAGYNPQEAQTQDVNPTDYAGLTGLTQLVSNLVDPGNATPVGQRPTANAVLWRNNEAIKNYAKLYSEAQSLPSIPVTKAKPDENGYDVSTNAITRIAESQFGSNSDKIEEYKKAIGKATGFNIYYDRGANQWYAGINTLEKGVAPLTISYNQATYLGGAERVNALMNTTNRFSAWESEQQRSGGTMQPKNLRLNTDAYNIRFKSEVRNGVQYPTIEYRVAGDEGATYKPLPKTYTNGIYTFDQLNERLNYLKNASQAQIEAILKLQ